MSALSARLPARTARGALARSLLLVPAAFLLGGCVLAIGNRVPSEELAEAGFEVGTSHENGIPVASKDPVPAAQSTTRTASSTGDEKGKERRELARKVESTRTKIEIAELERRNELFSEQRTERKLADELAVARAKLAIYRDLTMPTKVRAADLDLEAQQHRLQDAEDELRQLEMLYAGAELEDRTDEIVLARGRRQLDHARGRLQVAENERRRIVEKDLPLELGELERAVAAAEAAVEEHRLGRELSDRKHVAAVRELQSELDAAESELSALGWPVAAPRSATATGAAGSGAASGTIVPAGGAPAGANGGSSGGSQDSGAAAGDGR